MLTVTAPPEMMQRFACANCGDRRALAPVPYRDRSDMEAVTAIIILCGLCRRALEHDEIGANLEVRVAGQKGWNET